MSDLLSIGSSGVTAYQRALATVSNNIANVSTDGYSRQDVNIAANEPSREGSGYVGNGARFDQVRRQYDAFVETNLRNSNSDLSGQKPLLTYVNRLIDVMGDQSIGLTSAMNQFFKSAGDLATDPASTIQRNGFLQSADGMASRFRELNGQLQTLDTETRQAIDTDVGQINAYTQQLALLNKQLSKNGSAERQPAELLDQRDLLLQKLSGLAAIKTSFSTNGQVLVTLGDTNSQGFLVKDDFSRDIINQVSDTGELTVNYRYPPTDPTTGKKLALPPITSGHIGGILNFREQVLTPVKNGLDNLAKVMADEVNAVHQSGIDAEGKIGGALFGFTKGLEGTAAGMQVLIQDTSRVAAAGQFRIIDDPLNVGTEQARVSYSPAQYSGPTGLVGQLADGHMPQIGKETFGVGGNQPYVSVGLIAQGQSDVHLTLSPDLSAASVGNMGATFLVYTRDGRQLIGSPDNAMVKPETGMESGATWSNTYLNQTATSSYLGMDVFMGATAEPLAIQQYDPKTGDAIAPTIQAAALKGGTFDSAHLTNAIAAGDFTLNGVALGALSNPSNIDNVVQWLNDAHVPGVTASKVNGNLVLARSGTTGDIRLGLGNNGRPNVLKALGFDTTLSIKGSAKDDLLVFMSSQDASVGQQQVMAQFGGSNPDMKQVLRNNAMTLTFVDETHYKIVDNNTQTVLAERTLNSVPGQPTPDIEYRGLKLSFSTSPKAGDKFTIDGNNDGIGNNEAMMNLVTLENTSVMPGNLTMTEAYIEQVNKVGNVSKQATISQQALTVVYNQAKETRDSVSGVSLDVEASALVRYQQAYQANAKVMQTASQLFDAILQIK